MEDEGEGRWRKLEGEIAGREERWEGGREAKMEKKRGKGTGRGREKTG
jgi:hypothetical protein